MGMAASQARFGTLTGRKSDVEFHGQQINQQRTTLSTESAAYNTQLLSLTVPTPPSVDDFTKTTYTITVNGNPVTITGSHYNATNYTLGTDPTVYDGGTYTVYYDETVTAPAGKSSGAALFSRTQDAAGNFTYKLNQGVNGTVLQKVVTDSADSNYDATDASNTALITQDCHLTNPVYFKYQSSDGTTKYVTQQDLDTNHDSTNAIATYYVDPNATETLHSKIGGAQVAWDESGRMTSITDYNKNVYQATVNTSSDQDAYTNAMNEYEYQKALYNQDLNQINAKMSIIQSEDKTLELKLKDLDTQNTAIQTEMDSVKKVIDKNIEQSFKAFA
jgi:hypothetical protein